MADKDPRILAETEDSFTINNPETGKPEEHPKNPGAMDRLYEGLRGQNAKGGITNTYMESVDQIRKKQGWGS